MVLVDASRAFGKALEACGLDEPGGGELHATASEPVVDEARMLGEELVPVDLRDDRVREEGACVPDHCGIGQLAGAHGPHDLTHDGRGHGFGREAPGLNLGLEVLVAQHGRPDGGKTQRCGEHHEVAARLGLHDTVAVAEVALLDGEDAHDLFGAVVDRDGGKALSELDAVGADVLHDGSAHRARNGGEVLKTADARLEGARHDVVEDLARAALDEHVAVGSGGHLHALDRDADRHARHAAHRDRIGARAEKVHGQTVGVRFSKMSLKLVERACLGIVVRFGTRPEGGEAVERPVGLDA